MQITLKLKEYSAHILILIISLCYFAYLSQERLLSRDEGFYLYASHLVALGKTTYLDFFYPQMPLLPIIYGFLFKIFGISWEHARLFNAFFVSSLSLGIFSLIKYKFGLRFALLAVVLFLFSNYTIAWLTVCQTYAPSLLCLTISFLYFKKDSLSKSDIATASAFLAYAIQIRLFFIALLPIFLLQLLIKTKPNSAKIKDCFLFIIILIIFSYPLISLAFKDWDVFYFNNLGYHLDRSNLSSAEISENKTKIALVTLGLLPTVKFSAWQMPLLIYCSLLSALLVFLRTRMLSWSCIFLLVLFLLNLTPTPIYAQYFAVLLPFGIYGTIELLKFISNKQLALVFTGLLLLIYFYQLPQDYMRHLRTGEGLIGIMTQDQANHYNLKNLNKITTELKKECQSNETLIGFWPGYLVGTPCQAYPGTENHFGMQIAEKLSEQQQIKYQVINDSRLRKAILSQKADLVLLGKREANRKKLRDLVLTAGYESIWKDAGVEIFRLN